MKLYVDTMDAILVDFDEDGRVRFDREDWRRPMLQERRAVLFSAQREIESLNDLVATLDTHSQHT